MTFEHSSRRAATLATKKDRLDRILVDRELAPSRSKAKAFIMAGNVYVDGEKCDKAGTLTPLDASIEVRGDQNKYASRGGLKLEAALDAFGYECAGKVVIDVGASTGGFTDCVLQHGAARVYAVDVGYGQLAWKLRSDDRVTVIERTNIRHMEPTAIPEPCDLAVIDCSFISLRLVLPPTLKFLGPNADVIALVKPQFEVGPENVGKGGVVRDADARSNSIDDIVDTAAGLGLERIDGIDCPVHGPAGNVEYLVWLRRVAPQSPKENS
jgi:23S rRNA (cytidine1920-2'-O)/16S rRNA (cytidine1409-2'-O)-methyltransferase